MMDSRPGSVPEAADDSRERVFFALWPDAGARPVVERLAAETARRAHGRAPKVDNLHLTLAFVGDIEVGRIGDLVAIGADVARSGEPFTLHFDTLGSFRGSGIAWLGASVPPPALLALVETLRQRLLDGALPIDRKPFVTHVTLARRCTRDLAAGPIGPCDWRIGALALVASELGRGGPTYRNLGVWPLGGTPLPKRD